MEITNYNLNDNILNVTIDNIKYSSIDTTTIEASAIMGRKNNIWINKNYEWLPAINTVDINWNGAYINDKYGYIFNTSSLLNIIIDLYNRINDLIYKINNRDKYYIGLELPESDEWIETNGQILNSNSKLLSFTSDIKNSALIYFAYPTVWGEPSIIDEYGNTVGLDFDDYKVTNELNTQGYLLDKYTVLTNGFGKLDGDFTITWN